jgi:NADH:ubiquinone oxidoreductase subunit 3 (subunit A)
MNLASTHLITTLIFVTVMVVAYCYLKESEKKNVAIEG